MRIFRYHRPVKRLYAQTGLVTFSGPYFSSLGMLKGIEYTIDNMQKMLFEDGSHTIRSSEQWSDDLWFLDQENRCFIDNPGWWFLAGRSGPR